MTKNYWPSKWDIEKPRLYCSRKRIFYSLSWACILAVFLMLIPGCSGKPDLVEITSPSGLIHVSINIDSLHRLGYSVDYTDKPIIAASLLGITIDDMQLGEGVEIGTPALSGGDEKFPSMGVHDTAHSRYRQVTIPVTHTRSGTVYELQIKAFDDGVAFRYIIPRKGLTTVKGEASTWKIPAGSTVWFQENVLYYEGLYDSTPLSELGSRKIGPPLTYQAPGGIYACITEAALDNYSGMSLVADSGMLRAAFVNDPQGWQIKDTIITPWRVAIISPDLNGLVNSDLIGNLNPPPDPALAGAKWIRPGRAAWSYFVHENVTTMALEREYIDKGSKLGFEYNMVDAGWESSWPNCMDSLKALVDYAKQRNVGIWVWKSYESLKEEAHRRDFFKQLQDRGVAGVKIDFIDKEGIEQTRFYQAALRDAAAAHLMVDFHGANKPTGLNRTYPNELTREAIYGQEWSTYNPQGPTHNTITPFTRLIAGPADATPGVFDSKKAYGTSRAHQLGLQVIFNSVLSCWPSDPDVYLASAAFPFIHSLPTIWDETIVLAPSKIGEVAAFARRKGQNWFIGVINAGSEKRFKIPLTFLGAGNYQTDMLQDDLRNSDSLLRSLTVKNASDSLPVVLRPEGGYAAMLSKITGAGTSLSIHPQGGYLYATTELKMEATAGMDIRYTLDGKEPGPASPIYKAPISIARPTLVRAIAYNKTVKAGAEATAQFLFAPAPLFSSEDGVFIQNKTIRIPEGDSPHVVRYTLDGTEPTIHSPVYKDSLQFTKTTKLKARQFFPSGIGSSTAMALYVLQDPSKASTGDKVSPGLIADYFEGEWKLMPDFKKLKGKKSNTAAMLSLQEVPAGKEFYAVQFSGYIKIPATDVYTFYIMSDDGSQLLLDGELLVDNNGCHGDLEKSGVKALSAGLHRFTLNYFQSGSGQSLQVSIRSLGNPKQIISPAFFFH